MSCGTKVIESTDIKTSIYYSASSMSISFLIQNVLSFWLIEISGGEGGMFQNLPWTFQPAVHKMKPAQRHKQATSWSSVLAFWSGDVNSQASLSSHISMISPFEIKTYALSNNSLVLFHVSAAVSLPPSICAYCLVNNSFFSSKFLSFPFSPPPLFCEWVAAMVTLNSPPAESTGFCKQLYC